jgi:hypothetical protein
MNNLNFILAEAKKFSLEQITNYHEKLVYHDISFAYRLVDYVQSIGSNVDVSEDTITLAKIGAWIVAGSFGHHEISFNEQGEPESNFSDQSILVGNEFFNKFNVDEDIRETLRIAFSEMSFPNIPTTKVGMIIADSISADLVLGNGIKHLRKLYQELLLHDIKLSKKKWTDMAIKLSSQLKFNLPFCQEELQPRLDEMILKLEKEKKSILRTTDLAIRKELDISEAELKQLKKNLKNSKGRDDRGIQTVFRTTSKNHYTLNEMIDRKANIMITVNAIILSLVIGGVIGQTDIHGHVHCTLNDIPILLLTISAVGSIAFAILSIRPSSTHGKFTEDEIRNKGGNLLYFGNFHEMYLRDYEWAFFQMMNDQDFLYSSLIKDIYFQGKELNKKYKFIRIALTIFLIGIACSVLAFLLVLIF